MWSRIAVVLSAVSLAVACEPSESGGCTFNSQCPARHHCSAGACVSGCSSDDECVATSGPGASCTVFGMCVGGNDAGPRVDAGVVDSGVARDAGAPDSGTLGDASSGDAGRVEDAGVADATAPMPDASSLFDPITGSAQIAAIRAAPAGALAPALPLDGALVTYVRPAIGADPAGFFVQAQREGPALFVAIDPTTLSPPPARGDLVTFEVGETVVSFAQHRVTALAPESFARIASGVSAAPLVQDVSAVDVVAMLDAVESELVALDLTLEADVTSGCGAGHVCAQATTIGVPTASVMLGFRATPEIVAARGLRAGCALRVGPAPMGRFGATAQPSALEAGEATVTACPPFRLLGATATAETTVALTFDVTLDPGSVTPASFSLSDGATVSAAVASGRSATLTTSVLAPGVAYTVTVAVAVRDASGTAIDPGARTATFSYVPAGSSSLVINEVDYDSVGSDATEFVEIHNPSAASVALAGHTLVLVNGSGNATYAAIDLSPAGAIPAGGYLVVANATVTVAAGAVVLAWPGATDQIQNGAPDGIALVASGAIVDALSYEGAITEATVTGVTGTASLVEGTATTAMDTNAAPGSLARIPNGRDSGDASADWAAVAAPTPGAPN